jgi:saccharopine dehydrogenase (NAD+, L-lysine-forming)
VGPDLVRLWMRHKFRRYERRAALVPEDVRKLIDQGVCLTVEESLRRVFPAHGYAGAG